MTAAAAPAAELAQRARAARAGGRPAEALALLEEAIAAHPQDRGLRVSLAECLGELGRTGEAIDRLTSETERDPGFFAARHALAHMLRRAGRRREALDAFRVAAEIEPENPWPKLSILEERLELGEKDGLIEDARAYVAANPERLGGHAVLARACRESGDDVGALAALDAAVRLDPRNAWFQASRGASFLSLGQVVEADAAYGAALQIRPSLAVALHGRGLAAEKRGDRAQALALFAEAHGAEPDQPWFGASYAAALAHASRVGEATAIYESVVEARPNFAPALAGLAALKRAAGAGGEALDLFRRAAAAEPANLHLRLAVAAQLRRLGEREKAREVLHAIRARDPAFAPAAQALAELSAEEGDVELAGAALADAAALDPANAGLAAAVIANLRERGRLQDAVAEALAACRRLPRAAAPRVELSRCLAMEGRGDESLQALEEALEVEPNFAPAAMELARIHVAAGRIDLAERVYGDLLSAAPASMQSRVGLGVAARARGDHDTALARLRAAVDGGGPPWAYIELAEEWIRALRFDEARGALERGLILWPNDRHLMLQRARVERTADSADTLAAFRTVCEAHPRFAAARAEWIRELLRSRRTAEALEALNAAVAADPKAPSTLEVLAESLWAADRTHEARESYERADALRPCEPSTVLPLARLDAHGGALQAALERLDRLAAARGESTEIASTRAQILSEARFHERARAALALARTQFPEQPGLTLQSAAAAAESGDFPFAEDLLGLAKPSEPRASLEATWARAQLDYARMDFVAAQRGAETVLRADARDPLRFEFAARCALLAFDVDATERHLRSFASRKGSESALRGHSDAPAATHVGQLLQEWRIDSQALSSVLSARSADPPNRLRAIAEVVRAFPDYTPAAIALFIEARVCGRAPTLDAQPGRSPSRIPRTIAQFWDDGAPPPDVAALCATWKTHNPDFRYRLFDRASAAHFLLERVSPRAAAAFRRVREPAQKADIFRLGHLFVEGGFYVDADDRCVAPLAAIDPGKRPLIVYQEDLGSIANDVIGAVPGHPAIAAALASAVESVERGDSDLLWLSTGPGLLTRAVAQGAAADPDAFLTKEDAPFVLSRFELFRSARVHCPASYKQGRRHWSRSAFAGRRLQHAEALDKLCALAGLVPRTRPG